MIDVDDALDSWLFEPTVPFDERVRRWHAEGDHRFCEPYYSDREGS